MAQNPVDTQLEQWIGQLFVVGFEGESLPDALKKELSFGRCGGCILFARNLQSPKQIAELTASIYDAGAAFLPWISVDQEGGRVARLRKPFTELPPAAVLGILDSDVHARRFAEILGQEAAAAGFNLVFAPVLDVHTRPENPVIGDRSLATDAAKVARLGLAYADGLVHAHVMPCGKHFPGHGDTHQDSHLTLPIVSHPRDRLEAVEWLPFYEAVRAELPAIMTAHVLFPALDPIHPATLSSSIIRDILRDRWHYQGVVFSDDLEMKGVADHHSIEEIVVQGLHAGVDVFLICRHWEMLASATHAIRQAIERNEIHLERIHASIQRIQRAKQRFALRYLGIGPSQIEAFLQAGDARKNDAAFFLRAWQSHKLPNTQTTAST